MSGAISGGIEGYKYAKEQGANPWTNKVHKKSYTAEVKKGVSTQPDPTKHCYAYSAEYADSGHGNHLASEFISANGGAEGGDVSILSKVNPNARLIGAQEGPCDFLFEKIDMFGNNIQANVFEVAGTINNGSHWVNVIGISSFDRLSWFGGTVSHHNMLKTWNPIVGIVSWLKASDVTNIRVFKY